MGRYVEPYKPAPKKTSFDRLTVTVKVEQLFRSRLSTVENIFFARAHVSGDYPVCAANTECGYTIR